MLRFRGKKIYLACGATDMRKAIDGLAGIVQLSFKLDPFAGAAFVFCNRSRNRLKILEWDGDGFWLYFKRLERGRFAWPAKSDTSTMTLNEEKIAHLLEGTKLTRKILRQEVRGGSVS